MSVFNELVGQDDVITQLEYALHSPGAMTHAWLFTGPPGSGSFQCGSSLRRGTDLRR